MHYNFDLRFTGKQYKHTVDWNQHFQPLKVKNCLASAQIQVEVEEVPLVNRRNTNQENARICYLQKGRKVSAIKQPRNPNLF